MKLKKSLFLQIKSVSKLFYRIIKMLILTGWVNIVFLLSCSVIISVMPLITTLMLQKIINSIQLHGVDKYYWNQMAIYLILYIIIDFFNGLIILANGYISSTIQFKASHSLKMMTIEKILGLSLKDFEDPETYNTIKKVNSIGFERIYSFFYSIIEIIQSIISIGLFGIILIQWQIWIVPLILIVPVINAVIEIKFGKKYFQIQMSRLEDERKQLYYEYLMTNGIAIKEVIVFEIGKFFKNKYKKINLKFLKQDKEIVKQKFDIQLITLIIEQVISSGVFCFIIISSFNGKILFGQLTTYIKAVSNLKSNVSLMLTKINSVYENMLYIKEYFDFMDKKFVRKEALQESIILNNISSIELKDLSYEYSNKKDFSLKDINLKLKKGDLVAFVGKNGSGKTTLIKILSTLYDDYQGTIYFNGKDLKMLDIKQVRKKIAILFQDFMKYDLNVRENIGVGEIEKIKNDQEVWKALEKTGMLNKIDNLDAQLGYLFDQSFQLSGGEWLNIALSRVFIRDADIYLIDEPDSALDSLASQHIMNSFSRQTEEKIGIIVSHRISTIKNIANKIVVFNNGEIEMIGTHAELMESSQTYRDLYYGSL